MELVQSKLPVKVNFNECDKKSCIIFNAQYLVLQKWAKNRIQKSE